MSYLLTKTSVLRRSMVLSAMNRNKWKSLIHNFTSFHSNERDFWIVLYCTI